MYILHQGETSQRLRGIQAEAPWGEGILGDMALGDCSQCCKAAPQTLSFSVPSNVPNGVASRAAHDAPRAIAIARASRLISIPSSCPCRHVSIGIDPSINRIIWGRARIRRPTPYGTSSLCTFTTTKINTTSSSALATAKMLSEHHDPSPVFEVSKRQLLKGHLNEHRGPFHCGRRQLPLGMRWEMLSIAFIVILSLSARVAHAQGKLNNAITYRFGLRRRFLKKTLWQTY